jgi:ATP-dependent RNA helicase DHX8/PRP22
MAENDMLEQDFETLPVVSFKDDILAAVKKSQIVIIIGETGSGKTTQIPQFFVDEHLLQGKQIAVTQPRRIAAITVAERVSSERKSSVGEEVGYTVRFDDKTGPRTKIKYMTDGILVRECLSDKALSNYSVIMLDEAHERSLNTDILFGLLKAACKLRPDLRLIVTSATLNTEKFGAYFLNCPIIHVPGRVFPVDIYHSKTKQVMTASGPSNSSYVQAAVDVVLRIHRKDEEGHILIFLTGQDEIERACSLLNAALKTEKLEDRELIVLPLYAALTSEQQARVFRHPKYLVPKGTPTEGKLLRKCVIATNIAETSITVPQVRFVIDAGYVKQKAYDPSRGMESLVVVPSSKVGDHVCMCGLYNICHQFWPTYFTSPLTTDWHVYAYRHGVCVFRSLRCSAQVAQAARVPASAIASTARSASTT